MSTKPPGKSSAPWLGFLAPYCQELFLTVEYESYRSTAWIEVIRESAVLTLLALDVVDFEMIRAANRAKLKLI